MSKEKPKQYQVGIDTFERMRSNASFEEAMGFIRWNIDKYNTRKKGSDLDDYKKIKDYCDEAIWWIENRHIAEFNRSYSITIPVDAVDRPHNGDYLVIVSDTTNHKIPIGAIVKVDSYLGGNIIYVSTMGGDRRVAYTEDISIIPEDVKFTKF